MKDDGLGYLFMFFFCFFINLKVVGGTCGSIANRGQLRDALDGEVCACRSIFVKGQDIEISGKETQAEQHGTCNGCRPWNTITGLNYLYMITEDDGDFDTLRQVCQNCGGDVAIFNTSDTASEIESIMGELGLSDVLSVWIGIKRKTGQRELFEWLDGRTFSTVDRFSITEFSANQIARDVSIKRLIVRRHTLSYTLTLNKVLLRGFPANALTFTFNAWITC
ncbi:uncharacterized protein [Apostichopus japonicus]|uniref:uncharacterized protein isoform X1 n=1 Tax=Stichopus japonicus TaxID=307972 RepID=UPI003AB13206